MTACLAFGLVANVSVAVACAVIAQRHSGASTVRVHLQMRAMDDSINSIEARILRGLQGKVADDWFVDEFASLAARWPTHVVEGFGYRQEHASAEALPAVTSSTDIKWWGQPLTCLRTFKVEAGWPAKCLRHERSYVVDLEDEHREFQAGRLPGRAANSYALPNTPIVSGFIINTLFYALIGLLIWAAVKSPLKVRRWLRAKRRLCPACGFIIAPGTCAIGLCSECGATLPWMKQASS